MIAPNTILGHYEIIAHLGAGGMGEVWRALDTHLNREVAIKVLPTEYANNPDRLHRFEQEARATSALNHPNILTVHDLGLHKGAPYIVAELLGGEELRAVLKRGAIELSRALDYAQQIASGLAAAHVKSIVHRDLKPENLFVTTDSFVKILDFGLAKLRPPEIIPDSEAPTQRKATDPGTVMGTANYMSPEQARGQEVDARSDIFSLGLVLYEMIAGQPPFTGVNALDVIGAILNQEPAPLRQFVPDLPAELQRIVSKALRKDREQRYQHVKDLLIDLKDLRHELEFEEKLRARQKPKTQSGEGSKLAVTSDIVVSHQTDGGITQPTTSNAKYILSEIKQHKRAIATFLVVLVLTAAGGLGISQLIARNRSLMANSPMRVLPFTNDSGNQSEPAFSPDGNQIAYTWDGENGKNTDIYVKMVGSGAPLRLTVNPAYDSSPVWAPDGRSIAFHRVGSGYYRVPLLGGVEQLLAEFTKGMILGFTWSPDGKSLFASEPSSPEGPWSINEIIIASGERRKILSPPEGKWDAYPAISSDGKHLLFYRTAKPGIAVGGSLYVIPLSGGEPRLIKTFDQNNWGSGHTWTPDNTEIVFSSRNAWYGGGNIWRISALGGIPELVLAGHNSQFPTITRQGDRLAFEESVSEEHIYRIPIPKTGRQSRPPTKFIFSAKSDFSAQYSPDGKSIVFASDRSGSPQIWMCDSDGLNAIQLTSFAQGLVRDLCWSPDGRFIAFSARPQGQSDVYILSRYGGNPRRLTTESFSDSSPSWSRDGKWIYFCSDRSGQLQIWKMPVEGGQPIQLTKQGGNLGIEAVDGKVYYTGSKSLSKDPNERQTGFWNVPTKGGEEALLVKAGDGSENWALTEQGIYIVRPTSRVESALEFFSFATRQVSNLMTFGHNVSYSGISVSPDNQWLLFTVKYQSRRNIMLLENFR